MSNRQNTFLLKRSNVIGKIPPISGLTIGELALNTADAKLYSLFTSGTTGATEVREIGWDRIHRTGDTVTGDFNFFGDIKISGSSQPNGYALAVTGDTTLSGLTIVYGPTPTSAAIQPGVNNSYDLGNPSFRWREIFTTNIDVSNLASIEYLNVDAFSNFYNTANFYNGGVNITGNTTQYGNVYISGTSLSGQCAFEVDGNVCIDGNLNVSNDITITGNTNQIGNYNITGNTTQYGNITLSGNTSITGNTTQVGNYHITGDTSQQGTYSHSGNTFVTGNTSQIGNITLTGNTIQYGTYTHSGDTNQIGNYNTTGNTTQIGNIILSGNTSITGNTTQVGNFHITGNTSQQGTYSHSGNTFVTGNTSQIGNITLTGNTIQYGNVYISGTSLSGQCAFEVDGNVCIDGDVLISGDTSLNGDVCISDANSGGASTGTACLGTNLIPTSGTTYHEFQNKNGTLAHIGDLSTGEPNSRGFTYFENNASNTTFTAPNVATQVIGIPLTFQPYNNFFSASTGTTIATTNKLTYTYTGATGTTFTYLKYTVSLSVKNANSQNLTFNLRQKRGITTNFLPIGMSLDPNGSGAFSVSFNGIAEAAYLDEFEVFVTNAKNPASAVLITDFAFSMFT